MNKLTYKELKEKVNNLEKKLREIELNEIWITYTQSPIPTMLVREDGKFFKYNDAMAKLTGYEYNELPDIEAWLRKLYPDEEYRNKVRETAKKSMHKEINVKRDEFIITRKDGEQRHIAFSVYNILHETKPTNLQIVKGEDITDLKKAKEELIKSEIKFRVVVVFYHFYTILLSVSLCEFRSRIPAHGHNHAGCPWQKISVNFIEWRIHCQTPHGSMCITTGGDHANLH